MGYFQCMYALNVAHSKFTKLYKTVFPAGLDAYKAYLTPAPSRKSSVDRLSVAPTTASSLASSANASKSTLSIAASSHSPPSPPSPLSFTLLFQY
ncbi:hypothetical protein B0H14DRAFT_2762061 [Mycena olivaceomarginata]|nr:hypothetical protein B0H14DRAFT_2762061 [Mycena olivaceomarginata]